jgi:hypothetical protein
MDIDTGAGKWKWVFMHIYVCSKRGSVHLRVYIGIETGYLAIKIS